MKKLKLLRKVIDFYTISISNNLYLYSNFFYELRIMDKRIVPLSISPFIYENYIIKISPNACPRILQFIKYCYKLDLINKTRIFNFLNYTFDEDGDLKIDSDVYPGCIYIKHNQIPLFIRILEDVIKIKNEYEKSI